MNVFRIVLFTLCFNPVSSLFAQNGKGVAIDAAFGIGNVNFISLNGEGFDKEDRIGSAGMTAIALGVAYRTAGGYFIRAGLAGGNVNSFFVKDTTEYSLRDRRYAASLDFGMFPFHERDGLVRPYYLFSAYYAFSEGQNLVRLSAENIAVKAFDNFGVGVGIGAELKATERTSLVLEFNVKRDLTGDVLRATVSHLSLGLRRSF